MSNVSVGPDTWVLVAGTGSGNAPLSRAEMLASRAIGRALAQNGAGLVTCGWLGVDKTVTRAFASELQALGLPLSARLKQIVPRPDEPAFFGGDVIYVDKGVPEWVESVKRAHAVVLIGGLGGTYKTYQTARNEQVPVFPLPKTGGDAKRVFEELMEDFEKPRIFRRLSRSKVSSLDADIRTREEADGLSALVFDLMTEELSGRKPVLSTARPRPSSIRRTPSRAKRERVDFLLVTALPEERDALLRRLPGFSRVLPRKEDVHVYFRAELPVTTGTGVYQIAVLPLLGIGRVNAATATAEAIRRWRPRHVVLVGIAGGIAERNVALGDLLISEQVVDYELQKLTESGIEVRWSVHKASRRLYAAALNLLGDLWTKGIEVMRPGAQNEANQADPADSAETAETTPRIHLGPIASGDKVVAVEEVLSAYRNVWPTLIGVEMEAAGVASACFAAARQPEFFMIRGVSDLADAEKNAPEVESYRAYACEVAASYTIGLLKSHPIPFLKNRAR